MYIPDINTVPCVFLRTLHYATELLPHRGTRVIEARGKSSAMSAANAIANHLRDWLSSPAAAAPAASAATVRDENENSRRDGTQNKEDGGDEARGEEAREKEEEEEEEREGGEIEKDEKQKDEKEKNEKDGAAVAGVGVSMGVFSDGNPYGVPDGLVFSFPVDCGEGAVREGEVGKKLGGVFDDVCVGGVGVGVIKVVVLEIWVVQLVLVGMVVFMMVVVMVVLGIMVVAPALPVWWC